MGHIGCTAPDLFGMNRDDTAEAVRRAAREAAEVAGTA